MTRIADSNEGREAPQILADILAARGMTPEAAKLFLYPDYDSHRHDPLLLADMAAAVDRIVQAAALHEKVVVYGDYDIDGITASAVMIEALAAQGIEATSYIPDRFEEGYGINAGALQVLKAAGVDLVISVDCGITSVDEAAWARENGLDLIITDHHAVPDVIPQAIAVINPKRPGQAYPFTELAGVGVAYKLACALQNRTGKPAAGQEKWLLDLVALGTVCDVVPLVDENRVLASFGLKVMRQTRRVGLRALAAVGGVDIGRITAYDLGFVLGPRMNAAGRLEHAARSVELVMTSDRGRASTIAAELDELNRQRRTDQATILAMADEMAEAYADDPVLLLAHPEWSHGVVGIVASKLAEKWHKPVLLAQVLEKHVKGSARSVPGFNMVDALRSQAQYLTKFGGHFFAAGYTLPPENIDAVRAGLNQYWRDGAHEIGRPNEVPDHELEWADFTRLDHELMAALEWLEPHGNANLKPVFRLNGVRVKVCRPVGAAKQHLSMKVVDAHGTILGLIGFGLAERYSKLREGEVISIIGTLGTNEFQGVSSIQMVLSGVIHE